MLAVQPSRGPSGGDERDDGTTTTMGSFPGLAADEAGLLCDISFSDLFMGIDDGDVLPDLELDPADIFADFSSGCREEEADSAAAESVAENPVKEDTSAEEAAAAATPSEIAGSAASPDDAEKGRKRSMATKKRKAKVDWTPELHRKFVQAVEQLGIDKAVPSRILELMGIDCLTRHNIASHLQKYRSHRKHLLARELEAAGWNQRRQMYAAKSVDVVDANPWLAAVGPAIGFLPQPPAVGQTLRPPPPPPPPLHVWGHPHMWPPWPPQAAPLPPPHDPSFWHQHYQIRAFTRPPVVPGIVPHQTTAAIFRPPSVPCSTMIDKNSTSSQLHQFDAHPSKECIDGAIGDVIEKPWLPLPLGLKPPSLDSVLMELQKQGVSRVP